MDPNLQKIKEANIEDIRQGKTGTAIAHASSYLSHMLGNNWYQFDKELNQFKTSLLEERK